MAKFCRHCGSAVQGGRFCPSCGKPLEQLCSKCGNPLSGKVRFCPTCGNAVSAELAPARPEARQGAAPASPQRPAPAQRQPQRSVAASQQPQRPALAHQSAQRPAPAAPQQAQRKPAWAQASAPASQRSVPASPQPPAPAAPQQAQRKPAWAQASASAPQRSVAATPQQQQPQRSASAAAAPQQPQHNAAALKTALSQAATMPHVQALMASASAGEMDFGELTLPGLGNVSDGVASAAKVYAPLSGLFHGFGSIAGGALRVFKNPLSVLGVLFMAMLWFILAQFRGSDSIIVKFLSWLVFSDGGLDRSLPGTLCGILGKGTVACAWVSLFRGGLKNSLKGIKAFFTGNGEKRGFGSILLGMAAGFAAYFAFAGKFATADAAMAGISGSLLSLEALGGGEGKLYDLARSLTSKAQSGVRVALQGRCDGFLTGLTLGFAFGTALSLFLWVLVSLLG